MLSCVHDPCINCAASAYAEQVHIKGQNKDVYICEICGEETLLDTSTIAELGALASAAIKLPSKNTTPGKPSSSALNKRKETQNPSYQNPAPPAGSATKKIVYYCK